MVEAVNEAPLTGTFATTAKLTYLRRITMATIEQNLDPQVLERVKASLAVTGKVNVTTTDPDMELSKDPSPSNTAEPKAEINVDDFFGQSSQEQAADLRPEDIDKKDQTIMLALKECDELVRQANQFQEEFVVRGNQALYKLLSDIYTFALKVQLSEYRHHIIVAMRSALKDRNIKVQENTSEMMIVVKYVVGADRKRAANYARVLEVATKENLAAKDLMDYIARRGGISQIYQTEQETAAKQLGAQSQEKRLGVFREILICKEWESTIDFSFAEKPHLHSDEEDAKRSDFVFFMARYDRSKGVYKILHAHNFGEKFENQILRFMTKGVKANVETLQEHLRTYCQKLIDAQKVPEVIANIWRKGRLQLGNVQ
jgi:hypothetical protein